MSNPKFKRLAGGSKAALALMCAVCMVPLSSAVASSSKLYRFAASVDVAGPVVSRRQPACLKWANSLEESIRLSLPPCRAQVLGANKRRLEPVDDLIVRLVVMIQFGRIKPAFDLVHEQLKKYPGSAALLHLGARLTITMSVAYGQYEKLATANRLIALARAIEPDNPDILATHARLLGLADKRDEARNTYEEILESEPEHLHSLLRLSLVEQFQGNSKRALAILDRAVRVDPKNLEARRRRGELLYQMHDLAGAVRDLNTFLRAVPHDSEMLAIRLSANRRLGRVSEALADLSNLLAVDHGRNRFILTQKARSVFLLQRAKLLRIQGKNKAAFDDVVRAINVAEKTTILKLQLFLRRSGYRDLAITGKKSAALIEAMRSCLYSNNCWTDEAVRL